MRFLAVVSHCLELELGPIELSQVHQYLLQCDLAASSTGEQHGPLLRQLKEMFGQDAHSAFVTENTNSSRLHGKITTALETAFPGIVKAEEVLDQQTGYRLDAELERSAMRPGLPVGKRWALEVDGPSHFLVVSRWLLTMRLACQINCTGTPQNLESSHRIRSIAKSDSTISCAIAGTCVRGPEWSHTAKTSATARLWVRIYFPLSYSRMTRQSRTGSLLS